MSYLDQPYTSYDEATFPESDVQAGSYQGGIFTPYQEPESSLAQTISGTIELDNEVSYSDTVNSYSASIIAVGPNSFVISVLAGGPGVFFNEYIQFTDPSFSSSVGAFDYRPYNDFNPCFAAGTLISIGRGQVKAVEHLQVGDYVLSLSGMLRPIKWHGRRRVACARGHHQTPDKVMPIRVAMDAFGPGLPCRPLLLSPDHAVFWDDILVPIKCLQNDATIVQIGQDFITYHHLELEEHDVIFAEGMPCETFLDTGNRSSLSCEGDVVSLHADITGLPDLNYLLWETLGFAPLVMGGPRLDHLRSVLAARVGPQVAAKPSARRFKV